MNLKNSKKNHKKQIEQKEEEVLSRKLILDKREEDMKERELIVRETLKHEQLKYDKLQEKYNKEINDKNAQIEELKKMAKALPKKNSIGIINVNNIEIQELKKDYNDITNIFVNYKILVDKLITDEDFFFDNILIDKSIGNLKKKYPDIFDLLNEKESLKDVTKIFEIEKERLNNEIKRLLEELEKKKKEIKEIQNQLDLANKDAEENMSLYKGILPMYDRLKRDNDSLKRENVKLKNIEEEYTKAKNLYQKEIKEINVVIYSIFEKNKELFDTTIENLSVEEKNHIINLTNLFNPKW